MRLNLCLVLDSARETIYANSDGFCPLLLSLVDLLSASGSGSVQSPPVRQCRRRPLRRGPAPPDLLNSRKTPKPEAPRWESIPQTGPRIPRNRGTFSPNKIGQTWISSGRLRRGFCRSLKPPGVHAHVRAIATLFSRFPYRNGVPRPPSFGTDSTKRSLRGTSENPADTEPQDTIKCHRSSGSVFFDLRPGK